MVILVKGPMHIYYINIWTSINIFAENKFCVIFSNEIDSN